MSDKVWTDEQKHAAAKEIWRTSQELWSKPGRDTEWFVMDDGQRHPVNVQVLAMQCELTEAVELLGLARAASQTIAHKSDWAKRNGEFLKRNTSLPLPPTAQQKESIPDEGR